MKKILLVKTSSLGDVVHNFPVIADIKRRFPHVFIDWAVEETYAPLLSLSPGVHHTIPVAIRRWRRRLLGAATWQEIAELRRVLGTERYDAVIDTQGLLKSALIAAAAQGRRHGFDAASAREAFAARFYDVAHHVPRAQHAVLRNRQLAAAALGYSVSEPSDYGLRVDGKAKAGGRRGIVFLHSTSAAAKHWTEDSWIELGKLLGSGSQIVLPWGTALERERSMRIAACLEGAHVPEALALRDIAAALAHAKGVVGVDTGLAHLAAALGTPVVAIYCDSDPRLTGIHGGSRSASLGGPGRPPTPLQVFEALQRCGVV